MSVVGPQGEVDQFAFAMLRELAAARRPWLRKRVYPRRSPLLSIFPSHSTLRRRNV